MMVPLPDIIRRRHRRPAITGRIPVITGRRRTITAGNTRQTRAQRRRSPRHATIVLPKWEAGMTSLDRRGFISVSGSAAGGALLGAAPATDAKPAKNRSARKPVLMKLGTQEPTSAENLARFQRYGVNAICGWYR